MVSIEECVTCYKHDIIFSFLSRRKRLRRLQAVRLGYIVQSRVVNEHLLTVRLRFLSELLPLDWSVCL